MPTIAHVDDDDDDDQIDIRMCEIRINTLSRLPRGRWIDERPPNGISGASKPPVNVIFGTYRWRTGVWQCEHGITDIKLLEMKILLTRASASK